MAFVLFLNELSFGVAADRWAADAAMAKFDNVLRTFYEWNQETSLVDHIELQSTRLSPNYTFKEWINAEPVNQARWQFIRLRQSKAPFKNPILPGDVEYKYGDRGVDGLGFADYFDGLCVSLHVGDVWDSSEIIIDRISVDGDPDGEPVIRRDQEKIPHSSTVDNAADHQNWWQQPTPRLPVQRVGRKFRHYRFGIMTECLESRYFYSVDRARHGSSAVKRFVEQADALYWNADLDSDGNEMVGKHKSGVGIKIPWSELHAV
jgi:hypothetical protein